MQTQIDRRGGFDRRRQAPCEAGVEQHPHRLAEAGHHGGLAGLYLDKACHRKRDHDAQRRQRHAPVETRAAGCRAAVAVSVTPAVMVMMRVRVRVRMIQTHNIPRSRLSDAIPRVRRRQ
jgi:hypothetical protein